MPVNTITDRTTKQLPSSTTPHKPPYAHEPPVPDPPLATELPDNWMVPVSTDHHQSLTNSDDDSCVEEIYIDFNPELPDADTHCRRTTCQQTAPIETPPVETNIDPVTMHLHPTDCDTDHTNADTTPRVQIEDRPNSALPKRLNITKDHLLQSV